MLYETNRVKQSKSSSGWVIDVELDAILKDYIDLLDWLQNGRQLIFYDQFHPSISDPGGYVYIRRKENDFSYCVKNHGWSTKWQVQSKEVLAAMMHINLGAKDPGSGKVVPIRLI